MPDRREDERKQRLHELRDFLERRSWQAYMDYTSWQGRATKSGQGKAAPNSVLRQESASDERRSDANS